MTSSKNILLIGGLASNKDEVQDMKRYADYYKTDITFDVSYTHFDQLSFVIGQDRFDIYDHQNDHMLASYDLIVFRGRVRAHSELAYCVSRYCDAKSVEFLNDYSAYRAPSKLAQAITLYELGLPLPLTVYAKDKAIMAKVIADTLQHPLIIKSSMGSHGHDNFLSKTPEQTSALLEEHSALPLIAKSFFANKCDYRLLCMGSRELIIRRTAVGDSHLNNTSQGGSAELVEPGFLPARAVEQAHQFAQALKMTIAGVDVLYNDETGEYVFLEINSQPQLTDGAFPDEKRQLLKAFLADLS